jgi:uncharacterized protein YkwD
VVPKLFRRLALPTAAVLAALVLPASALADCPAATAAPAAAEGFSATLCLVNAQRTAQGLKPLASDARLQQAAQAFARDMVDRRFFDHVSPGGGTMMDRLHAAGWNPSGAWSAGENIAWGSGDLGTPARIVDAWMHSPGHRANILNGTFTQIGLGIASGAPQAGVGGAAATYVTDFGAGGETVPAAAPAAPAAKRPAARKPVARCAKATRKTARKTARNGRRCAPRR